MTQSYYPQGTCSTEIRFDVADGVLRKVEFADGCVSADGLVMGTYIHGIFDNDDYRRALLDALRRRKGLPAASDTAVPYRQRKEEAYNRLADLVRANLDMAYVRRVMGLEP